LGGFSIKAIFNRNNKLNAQGKGLVHLRAIYKRKPDYYNTHIYLKPDQWHNGNVVNHRYALDIQQEIEDLIYLSEKYFRDRIRQKKTFHVQLLWNYLGKQQEDEKGFVQWIDDHMKENGGNNSQHNLLKKLKSFMDPIPFDLVDYSLLTKFDKHLRKLPSKRGGFMSPNSIALLHAVLRGFINEAIREDLIATNPYSKFKIKKVATTNVALTEEEVEIVFRTKGINSGTERARKHFLFLLFSGMRFSDSFSIREENFTPELLKYVAGKTKTRTGKVARVPLNCFNYRLRAVFDTYNGRIPKYTNVGFNGSIGLYMAEIGIKKHVTAHVARHTFKTLLLERGYSLSFIAEMLGHSSIRTTENYGVISDNALISNHSK